MPLVIFVDTLPANMTSYVQQQRAQYNWPYTVTVCPKTGKCVISPPLDRNAKENKSTIIVGTIPPGAVIGEGARACPGGVAIGDGATANCD
jgi:hypothetical protein